MRMKKHESLDLQHEQNENFETRYLTGGDVSEPTSPPASAFRKLIVFHILNTLRDTVTGYCISSPFTHARQNKRTGALKQGMWTTLFGSQMALMCVLVRI